MNVLLELHNLHKKYIKHSIVINFSYTFTEGFYTIQGSNGSGKTTLISMLAGSEDYDSGDIILSGYNLKNNSVEYKQKICFVPSSPEFYPDVTVTDYFNFVLSIKKQKRRTFDILQEMIEGLNIKQYLHEKFKDLSLGTLKKVFLSTLSIGDPNLILLDEPLNGVDKDSGLFLVKYLEKLKDTIVIYSSHQDILNSKLNPTELRFPLSK